MKGFVYSFLGTLAAFLLFLWPLLVPFEVYEVHGYRLMPETACPGEPVRVLINREVKDPAILGVRVGTINNSLVNSEWEGSGVIIPVGEADVPLDPEPRGERISPVVREAPLTPGRYRLKAHTTVSGSVWWATRTLEESRHQSDWFEVVDCGE